MKLYHSMIFCIFIISCVNRNDRIKESNIGSSEVQENLIKSNVDSSINEPLDVTVCGVSDSITLILSKYSEKSEIDSVSILLLHELLIKNNFDETDCYFPRNSHEKAMFDSIIIRLKGDSHKNKNALLILFYFFDTSKRNIELVEYLQSKLAIIFYENTDDYINMLLGLNDKQQTHAIAIIEFVNSKDKLIELESKVIQLRSESNNQAINSVIEKIEQELNRQ